MTVETAAPNPPPPPPPTKRNPWVIAAVVVVVLCCGCFGALGLLLAFDSNLLNGLISGSSLIIQFLH